MTEKGMDLIDILDCYTRTLLGEYSEGGEKYIQGLEKNISNKHLGEDYASFRINPDFFIENTNSEKFFPSMVWKLRNYSGMHVDIYCGDFVLEILGDGCVGGGLIYKKGSGIHDFTLGDSSGNSSEAARRFIKYIKKDIPIPHRIKKSVERILDRGS